MKMNKTLIGFLFIAFVFVLTFGFMANASSINPNGQCQEGLWGTVLYDDHFRTVDGYEINVCKYTNPENITVSAHDFCYTVNSHWPRMYKTKVNVNGDYVCWINMSIETNWNTPNAVYRGNN